MVCIRKVNKTIIQWSTKNEYTFRSVEHNRESRNRPTHVVNGFSAKVLT